MNQVIAPQPKVEDEVRMWGASFNPPPSSASQITRNAIQGRRVVDLAALLCAAALCGGLSLMAYITTVEFEHTQMLLTL